jgi:hypothetical protein
MPESVSITTLARNHDNEIIRIADQSHHGVTSAAMLAPRVRAESIPLVSEMFVQHGEGNIGE